MEAVARDKAGHTAPAEYVKTIDDLEPMSSGQE